MIAAIQFLENPVLLDDFLRKMLSLKEMTAM